MLRFCSLLCALCVAFTFSATAREQLRLYTSPALGQLLAAAIPALHDEGIEAVIQGEAGSSSAINLLAEDKADAVFTVRALTGEDRAIAPDKAFVELQIASQATAFLVSRDVWESGVHTITRDQALKIYEKEITNWQRLGGPDRPIRFYNYTHGQGVWEQFAQWLYGEIRRAPLGASFEVVVSAEDARNTVEFNGGSLTIASPLLSDGKEVFALALGDNGPPVAPTREHILDRTYPLTRPVILIFGDRPTGPRLQLRDFFLGPKGQELIARAGLLPASEKPAP